MPFRRNPQFALVCVAASIFSIAALIGAEFQVKSSLVYVQLEGEPAVDIAIRLQKSGSPSEKIANATQKRLSLIHI